MCDQELISLREEVKELKKNKSQREDVITTLKTKITQLEVAISALTSDNVNLEAASRNHVSEVNSLKSNKVQLEADVEQRDQENAALKAVNTQLEVAFSALTSDKVQLEAEVKTRERIFSEREEEMNTLRIDLENINKVK